MYSCTVAPSPLVYALALLWPRVRMVQQEFLLYKNTWCQTLKDLPPNSHGRSLSNQWCFCTVKRLSSKVCLMSLWRTATVTIQEQSSNQRHTKLFSTGTILVCSWIHSRYRTYIDNCGVFHAWSGTGMSHPQTLAQTRRVLNKRWT